MTDAKLAALLAKQQKLAAQIKEQQKVAKERERKRREQSAMGIAQLAEAAGILGLPEEILRQEFEAIAKRHAAPAEVADQPPATID